VRSEQAASAAVPHRCTRRRQAARCLLLRRPPNANYALKTAPGDRGARVKAVRIASKIPLVDNTDLCTGAPSGRNETSELGDTGHLVLRVDPLGRVGDPPHSGFPVCAVPRELEDVPLDELRVDFDPHERNLRQEMETWAGVPE